MTTEAPEPTPARPRPGDSLATRLVRMLVLWVGGVWLVCVLGVVGYVRHEINANFDSELIEISHRMFGIALQQLPPDSGATAGAAMAPPPVLARPQLFEDEELIYRLLDARGRVLLRTDHAEPGLFAGPLAPGFHNTRDWRIYTVRHPARAVFMQVADPIDERRHAVNRTLLGLMVPLVAVLPLLALVLRHVARRELGALERLAGEVAERGGANLRPIPLGGLPRELGSVGEDVNHLLERLSQALDVERALAANAAHELRTPLAATRLRLQTALEHDLKRSDVEAALAALQTLSHRTERLLQLSRAESGAALARAPLDLLRLAATVAEEFWQDPQVAERLDLRVPGPGAAPVVSALGDVDALAIALRNLLENALRYGQGSRVVLEVAPPATLVVRDFGPGVAPELLGTLKTRHARQANDRAGYGLGLSIVATIAQQHGARLTLTSPPPGAASGFEARIELTPAGPAALSNA